MTPEEQKQAARKELARRELARRQAEADDYLGVLRGGDEAGEILARRTQALEAGEFARGDLRIEGGRIQTKDGRQVWPTPQTEEAVRSRIGSQAAARPLGESVGAGTRALRSIKMSPESQRQFTQAATGSAVIDTPEGQVVMDPQGRPQMVDPESAGTSLGILGSLSGFGMALLGPYAPLVAAAIEMKKPGATQELGRDSADWTGEGIEAGPEVAGELTMRRAGVAAAPRMAGQAGLAGVGTAIRRGISETLPGEDISMEETLRRARDNAMLSVAAEAPAALQIEGAKVGAALIPGSGEGLGPTLPERFVAKRLVGSAQEPMEMAAAKAYAEGAGIKYEPALLTLDKTAQKATEYLVNAAGDAPELLVRHHAENIMAQSKAAQNWATRAMTSSMPPRQAAEVVTKGLKAVETKLDTARKVMFDSRMAEARRELGTGRRIPYPGMMDAIKKLEREGIDTSRFRGMVNDYYVKEGTIATEAPGGVVKRRLMSVDEMKETLHQLTEMQRGLRGAEREQIDYMVGKVKNGLLADLGAAAGSETLGPGAQMLKQARESYVTMSKPINEMQTSLFKQALGLQEDLALEKLPGMIAGGDFGNGQVEMALTILQKNNPEAARQMERMIFDEVLSGASAAKSKSTLAKRTQISATARGRTEPVWMPGAASTRFKDKAEILSVVLDATEGEAGRKGARMAQLKRIADGFDRLAIGESWHGGSATARRQMEGANWKILADLFLRPREGLSELATLAFRDRLVRMITDRRQRDLVDFMLNPPKNATARTMTTSANQLAAMVVNAERQATEEEPEE